MRTFKVLMAVVVLVAGLGACGKHGAKNVYSCPDKQSGVGFKSVKKAKLTVETSLPSAGFWTGSDVDTLTGGYEFELAKDLCAQLGISRVRIVDQPLSVLTAGKTDPYDVAIAQLTTADAGTASTGYLATDQGIVVNAGTNVPNAAAAKQLTWGVEVGSTSGAFLNSHVKPTVTPRSYASLEDLFNGLKAKEVDAVLAPTVVALRNLSGTEQVVAQFPSHEQLSVTLPKGSANAKLVAAAIAKLKANGTLDDLATHWLTGPAPASIPFIAAS